VLPKTGRRLAGGCTAVFMLPFLAAGISVIAVGVRELRGGGGTQQFGRGERQTGM
jgi:hypothetical protein